MPHPNQSPALPELLAPAGGPAPFAAALAAGADAIYCGMGSFNARRKADNFDDASFEAACRAAHLAGARVYVTVNILIKQAELSDALELVRRCAELGADAFIIQDWGLFALIRQSMPELELHVSTQANIHDARGTAFCRDAGADRVTLSRELSITEIAQIHDAVDIDLEVFAHGSICFSYSGVCLLSSFACAGRSANRGMCAQPCRLPYELVDTRGTVRSAPGRGRPLCPRDTNTTYLIPQLIEAGAGALKLEGRMKAPDYVFSVTDAYRRELDALAQGADASGSVQDEIDRQLKRCFNRDFTCAYQLGTSGDEMMSYERSNNRGQIVGETVGFLARQAQSKGQRMRDAARGAKGLAQIQLSEPVGAGDLLELRHADDPDRFLTGIVTADAPAGAVIEVEIARPMPRGCVVRLIRSQRALDVADAALKRPIARKRPVRVRVRARLGEPFTVEITCADDASLAARATGFTVEAARTRPVSAGDLEEHVGRMGSSPFEAISFDIDLDEGCGMGFSAVHKVRAAACDALEACLLAPYAECSRRMAVAQGRIAHVLSGCSAPELDGVSESLPAVPAREPEICALVGTLEAADAARDAGATRIYLNTDDLAAADITPDETRARDLIPVLDEVCRADDVARLDAWIAGGAPVAVGNISELVQTAALNALTEVRSCIPVHNRAAARFLIAHGAAGIWLSPEITLTELSEIARGSEVPMGLSVLGRPRVMTSEHCILQVANACCHDCARCNLRREKLFLHNIDDQLLPVRTDIHGRSRLYAARPLDLTPQVPELLEAGITRFLVDGTLMEPGEVAQGVTRLARALDAARVGRRPAPRTKGSVPGCLFVGVD